jgi:hypothetical protein
MAADYQVKCFDRNYAFTGILTVRILVPTRSQGVLSLLTWRLASKIKLPILSTTS